MKSQTESEIADALYKDGSFCLRGDFSTGGMYVLDRDEFARLLELMEPDPSILYYVKALARLLDFCNSTYDELVIDSILTEYDADSAVEVFEKGSSVLAVSKAQKTALNNLIIRSNNYWENIRTYTFKREKSNRYIARKEVRDRIFSRDCYSCTNCGSKENLSIDHIVPIRLGGSDSDDNLQTLCVSCNSKKGAR